MKYETEAVYFITLNLLSQIFFKPELVLAFFSSANFGKLRKDGHRKRENSKKQKHNPNEYNP